MTKSSKCVISFNNNPLAVYYAGQIVGGTIELTTTKPKSIRSMRITIIGVAQTRWIENVRRKNLEGKSESVQEFFHAEDTYLSSETIVYGQNHGNSLNLPPGRYTYPFQVALPPHCPTSMNGQYGQIRYDVTFKIDRPVRYDNVFKQPFTVISPLDLNFNSAYNTPIEIQKEKNFCCGFCCGNKNPIIVKVNLPQTGYTPGQKLQFSIFINNLSTSDCNEIKVKLLRLTKYTCHTPDTKIRSDELKVAEIKLGPVIKQSKRDIKSSLEIPATTPSSLETCNIIHLEYTLYIVVKISGLHTNIKIPLPITIGTVPIVISSGVPVLKQPGMQSLSNVLVPSSFEEDINKTLIFPGSIENKNFTNIQFKPKYPMFTNSRMDPHASQIISQSSPQSANIRNMPQSPNITNISNNMPYPTSPYPLTQNQIQQNNQIGWAM